MGDALNTEALPRFGKGNVHLSDKERREFDNIT
jgi:hypothetical protein